MNRHKKHTFSRDWKKQAALLLCFCFSATAEKQPNILFIISDDLKTSLGCYSSPEVSTPELDALASEGMTFERAYVQGAYCVPSRKSFLTGLGTATVGANNSNYYEANPGCLTMGRFFKANGYETISIGKSEHNLNPENPSEGSWDYYIEEQNYDGAQSFNDQFYEDGDTGTNEARHVTNVGTYDDLASHTAYHKVSFATNYFENTWNTNKPFFMALGFHKPHTPWLSARDFYDLYDTNTLSVFENPLDMTESSEVMLHNRPYAFTEARQREMLKAYYACVSTIDSQIGRILDYLRDRGMLDNTIVAFTSDHGYHLGYRGQWNKHNLYEEVAQVPLIFRYPSVVQAGTNTQAIAELIDLFPTFADLAGLTVPGELEGVSLRPVLQDPAQSVKTAAFTEVIHRVERDGQTVNITGRAVRTDRWRYVEWGDNGSEGIELYDHDSDPLDFYNLAQDQAYRAVLNEHQQLIKTQWNLPDISSERLVTYDFQPDPTPSQVDPDLAAASVSASDITEYGDPDDGGSSPDLTNFSGASLNIKRNALDTTTTNFSDYLTFTLTVQEQGQEITPDFLEMRFNNFSDGFSLEVYIDSGNGFVSAGSLGGADNTALADTVQQIDLSSAAPAASLTVRVEFAHSSPPGANTSLQFAQIGFNGTVAAAEQTPGKLLSYEFQTAPTLSQVDPDYSDASVAASNITESGDPDGGGSSPELTNFSGASLNIKRNSVDSDTGSFSDYLTFSLSASAGKAVDPAFLELRFNSFSDQFSFEVYADAGSGFESVGGLGGADNSAYAFSTQQVSLVSIPASGNLEFRIECAHANPGGAANTTLQFAQIDLYGNLTDAPSSVNDAVLGFQPGGGLVLHWSGSNGLTYVVEKTTSLVNTVWTEIFTNATLESRAMGMTGSVEGASGFYRVRVQP